MNARPLLRYLALLAAVSVAASCADAALAGDHVVSVSRSLVRAQTVRLPHAVTDVALHWRGQRAAQLSVALSRDGRTFGAARRVVLDEVGEQTRRGETYGALISAAGARFARIRAEHPLSRVTLVAFADRGSSAAGSVALDRLLAATSSSVAQPTVIPRSGWGADESLRFDSTGKEIWPPAFYPVQKVIVHHTATQNNDPNPAATIRSIYQYHAVTQGWGDIGYNFLIDESGQIYEGRYSRPYAPGESPTGEDTSGNGVTAAHVQGYNSGTVGIALLGTLTNQDATPAARSALEHLIAWIDSSHGIDPQASTLYTNPVSGTQATFANIAGHRDLAATECPGGVFYSTLPTIRADVAGLMAGGAPSTPDFALGVAPATQSVVRGKSTSYTVSVTPTGGFNSSVTFAVSGLPSGATATFAPNPASSTSTLTVGTTSAAKTGTFTLSISGTSGATTHVATATLQIRRK